MEDRLMIILLLTVGTTHLWYIVGCIVLSWFDHEDRRLFKWASSGPLGTLGFFFVVMTWPYWVWRYLKK